jgi:hypothetical protein
MSLWSVIAALNLVPARMRMSIRGPEHVVLYPATLNLGA